MNGRASVTVAVCTRNRPEPLARCLTSLAALDPGADEIVVADQSDPPFAERVRSLCRGRTRYLAVTPRGLGFSRQQVLDAVRTEILAFTDDDCRVRRDWVRGILNAFARWPEAAGATGALRPPAGDGPPAGLPEWVTRWGDDEPRVFRGPAYPAEVGGGLNMAFRVDALRAIGGFDPLLGAGAPLRTAEDADVLYRLLKSGWTLVYAPDVVVSHHPGRGAREQQRTERGYAFGLGAWAAKEWRQGDRLPGTFWWRAFRRNAGHLVRRLPFDGARRSTQRGIVAWHMVLGWIRGARAYRAIGKDSA